MERSVEPAGGLIPGFKDCSPAHSMPFSRLQVINRFTAFPIGWGPSILTPRSMCTAVHTCLAHGCEERDSAAAAVQTLNLGENQFSGTVPVSWRQNVNGMVTGMTALTTLCALPLLHVP